jgi:NADH-quinone oxidoreductase subunit N
MPTDFAFPTTAEYIRFLPETILVVIGTLIMVLEGFAGRDHARKNMHVLAFLGIAAAMAAACFAGMDPGQAFNGFLIVDGYGTFFRMLILTVGLLSVLCSSAYLDRENADSGEYYSLLLFSLVGQCILATANELIMVFIGLEISSIATYVLAGYLRDDKRNNESAIKYFLLGSFATAFLLYGVAWIYGMTGSTNLDSIRNFLATDTSVEPWIIGAAAALLFVGFAFKVSAAPFQAWTPDVYQGAPAPVTAFMSSGPKVAAFAVFIRVFVNAFGGLADRWEPVVWISALATMVIGNFAALLQTNLKRVLAYSSIAHAGYVLVAVTAHSNVGTAAAMFYLASYVFMNLGVFAIVSHFTRKGERYVLVNDLAGLSQGQPATAALLTVFLLSLIGVPLTSGFFGKFYIFKAAIDSNLIWLAVLGLLNSAVAAYYYLRIIVVMYFHEPAESTETLPDLTAGVQVASVASAVAVVVLGVAPSILLTVASAYAGFGR